VSSRPPPRRDDSFPERAEDIREMYETTDVERALVLLRQYRVKYVVVGDLERIIYAADGLRKFEDLARKVFEIKSVE